VGGTRQRTLTEPTPSHENCLTARRARALRSVPPPHLHDLLTQIMQVPVWLRGTLPEIGCILILVLVRDAVLGTINCSLSTLIMQGNNPKYVEVVAMIICRANRVSSRARRISGVALGARRDQLLYGYSAANLLDILGLSVSSESPS
jgi:hypothetical protein